MKHIVMSALLVVMVIGCGVSDPKQSNMKVNAATAIKIHSLIPYKKGAKISASIKNECKLQDQLSEFIHAYSVGEGIGVIRKNRVRSDAAIVRQAPRNDGHLR